MATPEERAMVGVGVMTSPSSSQFEPIPRRCPCMEHGAWDASPVSHIPEQRTVCFRLTDHGLGHFLSAVVCYGQLADKLGMNSVIDLRHHRIAASFAAPVWPADALAWCEALDERHPTPTLHGALPSSQKKFDSYFAANALAVSSGQTLLVGGPRLPNGPLDPKLPERWRDAIASVLSGARSELQAEADALRRETLLHFRLGDSLSFGFSFQKEAGPDDHELTLSRCVDLVRQHVAADETAAVGHETLIMSDCARLLQRLRVAGIPGVVCVDGDPTHCRAAGTSGEGSLDTTVRDALVLLGARNVLSFSVYEHGSLFARLLANCGGGNYRLRPIFPKARHRCAGLVCDRSRKGGVITKRRCSRLSPAFLVLQPGAVWTCSQHA